MHAIRLFAAALLLPVLAACGDSTGPRTTVAGTWTLQTVNGTKLPYLFPNVVNQDDANKLELSGAVLTIEPGGSLTRDRMVRITLNGQVSSESEMVAGTYTISGSAVTVSYDLDGRPAVNGSWSGNTLTIVEGLWSPIDERVTLVYTRQ